MLIENLSTPYSNLTPELILAAIESVGVQCTGSLLALNSYENRVYQVGINDASPLIAKFYRPHRWSKLLPAMEYSQNSRGPCSSAKLVRHTVFEARLGVAVSKLDEGTAGVAARDRAQARRCYEAEVK